MTYALIFIAFVFYLCYADNNVLDYVLLQLKLFSVNVERFWWMVRFHPKNPLTNLIMKMKYDKIAKELRAEFDQKALDKLQ
jgi:hypothetical protein